VEAVDVPSSRPASTRAALLDPISKIPEFKVRTARIEKLTALS
jgi:hypothetical protein